MPPSTPDDRSRDAGRRPKIGRQLVIFLVLVSAALVAIAAVTGDRGFLDVKRQRPALEAPRRGGLAPRGERGAPVGGEGPPERPVRHREAGAREARLRPAGGDRLPDQAFFRMIPSRTFATSSHMSVAVSTVSRTSFSLISSMASSFRVLLNRRARPSWKMRSPRSPGRESRRTSRGCDRTFSGWRWPP